MIRSYSDFIKAFSGIASEYEWFMDLETIHLSDTSISFSHIRGGKDGDFLKYFSPITAYVFSRTGRYFAPDRFDLAASAVFMGSQCAIQIADAADEWPDRLTDYQVKPYELKIRNQLIEVCGL
jgi:hypothetical protein